MLSACLPVLGPQVWTGLLLVDTSPAKATLTAHAEAAVEELLAQVGGVGGSSAESHAQWDKRCIRLDNATTVC